ncbi:MAG: hypothetical protein KTR13_01070 [Saprospiraceae bacterium]|nr:hypothetical protein [Saprospiraceae bacterium]
MEETSTLHLSVKTLYENLTEEESIQLHAALEDLSVQREFDRMAQMKEALGNLQKSPSTSSIQLIMKYSRESRALEQTC